MILLQKSDFTGQFDIPDSKGVYTAITVQNYIDRYEMRYLNQLLGVDLAAKIKAYLAASRLPLNADYDYIIDAFSYQNPNSRCGNSIKESAGMKEMLTGCIFYEYVSNALMDSQAGVVNPLSETATNSSPAKTMRFAENKFNGILDTVEAIQWYCLNNPDKYSDFSGQRFIVKLADFL